MLVPHALECRPCIGRELRPGVPHSPRDLDCLLMLGLRRPPRLRPNEFRTRSRSPWRPRRRDSTPCASTSSSSVPMLRAGRSRRWCTDAPIWRPRRSLDGRADGKPLQIANPTRGLKPRTPSLQVPCLQAIYAGLDAPEGVLVLQRSLQNCRVWDTVGAMAAAVHARAGGSHTRAPTDHCHPRSKEGGARPDARAPSMRCRLLTLRPGGQATRELSRRPSVISPCCSGA